LLTAVIKIVTTYTQPGQRVLLAGASSYLEPPASWSPTGARHQSTSGPYAGLHEAGWTVVRLGRGVQTQTAAAHLEPITDDPGDASAESESGPVSKSPTSDQPADRRLGPDSTATDASPDRGPDLFDLVIATAEPRTVDRFRPTDWAGKITPTGVLAVITRGSRSADRLTDPAGSLVRDAHRAGLRYVDRIALLRVPIRDGALVGATSPTRPLDTPVRHSQMHDDLLVFSPQQAPTGAVGQVETSDD